MKELKVLRKKLRETNYDQQSTTFSKLWETKPEPHLSPIEHTIGSAAMVTANNYQKLVITYLNKLIHILQKAGAGNWIQQHQASLLSFTIGDLMRCKFSSHER